jgi:hypothetical protein
MVANMNDFGLSRFLRRMLCNHDTYVNVIDYVYAHTDLDSPLRSFFVDSYCDAHVEETNQTFALMKYPKEFLADIMVRRTELAGSERFMRAIAKAVRRVEEWQVDGEETGRMKLKRRGDGDA